MCSVTFNVSFFSVNYYLKDICMFYISQKMIGMLNKFYISIIIPG